MKLPSPQKPTAEDPAHQIFVRRLERLIRLRREYQADLNSVGVELLNRAIYATYRDCLDAGAVAQAQRLLPNGPSEQVGGA
jgi:hypothetical protein